MPVVRATEVQYAELPGRQSADPMPAGMGSDYSVRMVRVVPGPRTPHLHPHSDEVTYVVSGSGVAWEGDASTAVGPGDTIFVPQGAAHVTVSATDEMVLLCFFPRADLVGNLVELDGPVRS